MNTLVRKFVVGLLLLLGLPSAWAQDAEFKEGVQYQRLKNPVPTSTGDKLEVVEAFWYGCPHCYALESTLEEWLKHKPDNVEFVRIPAVLGRTWEPHAQAYYAAQELGVLDKIHKPLFDAIHAKKRLLANEQQLADFFAEQGVDRDAFLKAYDSFAVTKVQLPRSEKLIQSYGVQGVPAIIVNGKYITNITMAGSPQRVFEVVDYLLRQESDKGG